MHNLNQAVLDEDMADEASAVATNPAAIIFEAIARKLCFAATYNKAPVVLAPHVVYTRREGLFLDAVTVERGGAPPRERKLGAFKLSGLAAMRLTTRPFSAERDFEPAAPKYAETLFALED